jgi:hypothetical protein
MTWMKNCALPDNVRVRFLALIWGLELLLGVVARPTSWVVFGERGHGMEDY